MPEVEIVATPLQELTPSPWNPRLIQDGRFKNLCRSIEQDPEFLWRRPVLAQADGTIYAGNMRYRAAMQLGHTTIPAIVEDVDEQTARERAVRDNQQWGEWQEDELAELLESLKVLNTDIEALGLDERELARILRVEEVPEGFKEYGDDLETNHQCPKCGYVWAE